MNTITATQARSNLYRLIDDVFEHHTPLQITNKGKKVVMLSEEDYEALQETLYLLSVPGMHEKIQEGLATPKEECLNADELAW